MGMLPVVKKDDHILILSALNAQTPARRPGLVVLPR
jgi:hypothetical protein